jgi:hypothetical protein
MLSAACLKIVSHVHVGSRGRIKGGGDGVRPTGISTIAAGAVENMPGNRFSPTPQGGFCTPRAGSSFTASTDAVSAAPAGTANKDRPLTSSNSLPRPALGGSPVEAAYAPGTQPVPAW